MYADKRRWMVFVASFVSLIVFSCSVLQAVEVEYELNSKTLFRNQLRLHRPAELIFDWSFPLSKDWEQDRISENSRTGWDGFCF